MASRVFRTMRMERGFRSHPRSVVQAWVIICHLVSSSQLCHNQPVSCIFVPTYVELISFKTRLSGSWVKDSSSVLSYRGFEGVDRCKTHASLKLVLEEQLKQFPNSSNAYELI